MRAAFGRLRPGSISIENSQSAFGRGSDLYGRRLSRLCWVGYKIDRVTTFMAGVIVGGGTAPM